LRVGVLHCCISLYGSVIYFPISKVFCIGLKSGVLQFDTAFWVGRGERLSKDSAVYFCGFVSYVAVFRYMAL
jgi:hypothetical protein